VRIEWLGRAVAEAHGRASAGDRILSELWLCCLCHVGLLSASILVVLPGSGSLPDYDHTASGSKHPFEGQASGQRMRTLRQVTQPSSFSNSEMSTVTTR